jgi:hypothetical protein
MPEFPLDDLTIRDGVLTLLDAALPPSEYLATQPVQIVAKSQLVELTSGDVSYLFALNHVADSTWIEIFSSHLDDLAAEIQGSQVEIRCNPADLERSFARVKDALARTNRNYAELKSQLSQRVTELDAERRSAERARDERNRAIQHQFDELPL